MVADRNPSWFTGLLFLFHLGTFDVDVATPDIKVMGQTWGPSGATKTYVGPMLAP